MATFTATVEPTTASVLLVLSGIEAAAVSSAWSLTRTDANGNTAVRLLAGQTLAAGTFSVRDYEASLSGSATYTFMSAHASIGTMTRTVSLGLTSDWLSLATLPQFRAIPHMTVDLEETRTSQHTVHEVIGRSDWPVSIAPLGLRTGTVTFMSLSRADARALAAIYSRGEAAFLRFAEGTADDLYHFADSVRVSVDKDGGYTYAIAVTFREVSRPSGPLRGSLGWTYASVKARSYAQIKAQFATYAALTIGETS